MMTTTTTKRPAIDDPSIPEKVAIKLSDDVLAWTAKRGYRESMEDILRTLTKTLRENDLDAYQLARALEKNEGWEPDMELLQELDMADTYWDAVYRDLVEVWVRNNNVTLAYRIGAKVRVSRAREGEHDGIVIRRDEKLAEYTVMIPALGHAKPGQIGTTGWVLTKEKVEK